MGGAIGLVAGEVVIGLLRGGLLGRALSWAVLGLGIGLGQGLADRSRERLIYGLIGGGLGGFVGGFLFEWLRVALGDRADVSQAVGIVILGAGLGLVPGPGRAGVAPRVGPGAERPPGGTHLSAGSSPAAGWGSTSAPRSASSATRQSPAATPRSRRRRADTSCTTWQASRRPRLMERRSPIDTRLKMETASSLATPFLCFANVESMEIMRIPRFYIIQYLTFTAVAALVFAIAVGKPSENMALALGLLFLAGLSPALLPLLPNSVESVLLNLPGKPDEQITALEGVLSRRAIFRPGPQRSARLKLMRLYVDQERFAAAISLGRTILAQFRMPYSLESELRLEMSTCLKNLGRDHEAKDELQWAFDLVARTRTDAQGWFMRGKLLDASHRYAEAIDAYEKALSRPLFERKAIHAEACRRLVQTCVKAGRPQQAIDWSERLLQREASRSTRYFLHLLTGQAYASLGKIDEERHHKGRAYALALEVNDATRIEESLAALGELKTPQSPHGTSKGVERHDQILTRHSL